MFSSSNDTTKWAVCVDRLFGLFETEEDARACYQEIGGTDGSDGLGDTPFGSAELLPPGYLIEREPFGGWERHTKLSEHRPIDIRNYIRRNWQKWNTPWRFRASATPVRTARDRLADRREMKWLLGE